jgi:UDP-glucose 6-dehydrogenase
MRVTIIGTGYVGLFTGACLSDFGHLVTCVEKDADKIAQLADGRRRWPAACDSRTPASAIMTNSTLL